MKWYEIKKEWIDKSVTLFKFKSFKFDYVIWFTDKMPRYKMLLPLYKIIN